MNSSSYDILLNLLNQLEDAKIPYTLARNRQEAIMVTVAVPGERWEIEILSDGNVEIEKFISDGHIRDHEELRDLFQRFTD